MDWEELLDGMTTVVVATFPSPIEYERAETGEVVTTTPSGAPLTAVFDVENLDTSEGGGRVVSNRSTVIDIRLADLGFQPSTKDKVTVRGKTYTVLDKDPSSSGMMKLKLRG